MTAQQKIATIKDLATRFKGQQHLDEHERDLWLVYAPHGYDEVSTEPMLPASLMKIEPRPRIVDKPLDTILEKGEGGGIVGARLQRIEVTRVSRTYTEEQLRSALYFIIVEADKTITPEEARDRTHTRYILLGTPDQFEQHWKLMLVQKQ